MKDEDLSGIMTIHTVFDNIDPDNISTFSEKVVNIIREQGFDGVIFSDSLAMMAIAAKYGLGESVPKAVAAGHGGMDFAMLDHFFDAVINNKPAPISLRQGLAMTLPGIYAEESVKRGGQVMRMTYPWDEDWSTEFK